MRRFALYIIVVTFSLLIPWQAMAYEAADCIGCHSGAGEGSVLKISLQEFQGSVHGEQTSCLDCHGGVVDDGHQETPGSGAVNCGECHEQVNRHGLNGRENRPQCYDCHTRHGILPPDDARSSVNSGHLPRTCAKCHLAQSGGQDYLSWLPSLRIASHPKQDFSQDYSRKNCLGCHQGRGSHGERSPRDGQDCQTCHLDSDGKSRLLGSMHPWAHAESQPGVFTAALVYQAALIILLIGGFLGLARALGGKAGRRD